MIYIERERDGKRMSKVLVSSGNNIIPYMSKFNHAATIESFSGRNRTYTFAMSMITLLSNIE